MTDFDFDFFLKEFSLQDKKDKFENETNKINIDDKIINILFDYQEKHLRNLINILSNKNIVIDGSDTGTGKTYIAAALSSFFKLKPFIVCPKAIMSSWKIVLQKFDIIPLAIVNYETIKVGKSFTIMGKTQSLVGYIWEKKFGAFFGNIFFDIVSIHFSKMSKT